MIRPFSASSDANAGRTASFYILDRNACDQRPWAGWSAAVEPRRYSEVRCNIPPCHFFLALHKRTKGRRIADRHARIERRIRILKYDLDLSTQRAYRELRCV